MHTETIARSNSFYAQLPERVRPALTEIEWKAIALFIEERLPQWSRQASESFHRSDTGLALTVHFDAKKKGVVIPLKEIAAFQHPEIDTNILYDHMRPMVQWCR